MSFLQQTMEYIMPNLTDETPRVEIICQGITLASYAPFAEGHVLTDTESKVLNQTFNENLRNNFANVVKNAKSAVEDDLELLDLEDLQSKFDDYATSYEFGVRRTGGGGGTRGLTPVEKESLRIAKNMVKEALRAKNYKLSDVPAAQITKLATDLIENNPKINEMAQANIAVSQEIAASEINLDDLELAAEEAEAA